jgi:hypothetical protein
MATNYYNAGTGAFKAMGLFGIDQINSFDKLGYGEVQDKMLQGAAPLTLRDLATRSATSDNRIAQQFKVMGRDQQQSDAARGFQMITPGMQRRMSLAKTAEQVNTRNLTKRNMLDVQAASRAAGAEATLDYDAARYEGLGTTAAAKAGYDNMIAMQNAQKRANKRGLLGSIVGIGGAIIGGVVGGPAGAAVGAQAGGLVAR